MEFDLNVISLIHQQIDDAINSEKQSGNLVKMLCGFSKDKGEEKNPEELEEIPTFIEDYVKHSPILMTLIHKEAEKSGVIEDVIPILDVASKYFLIETDVIPDHLGLVGLLDDAYFTNRLIQEVSDRYKEKSGKGLIQINMSSANSFVRRLIAEPRASFLDEMVDEAINGTKIMNCLQVLALNSPDFGNLPAPSWNEKNIKDLVDLSMVKLGISSKG
ncbi:MAG: uncharacterized membrane protein YkvA (DUF1232 family) [Chlamydiales bacterium]|jgi:uncharacterized membrane protein YkvA (DUF1232 family)